MVMLDSPLLLLASSRCAHYRWFVPRPRSPNVAVIVSLANLSILEYRRTYQNPCLLVSSKWWRAGVLCTKVLCGLQHCLFLAHFAQYYKILLSQGLGLCIGVTFWPITGKWLWEPTWQRVCLLSKYSRWDSHVCRIMLATSCTQPCSIILTLLSWL